VSLAQIHPMIVHFPIVFVLMLAAFDLVAMSRGADLTSRSTTANISASLAVLAGLSAIIAFVFGDIAYDTAVARGFPEARLEMHEGLGTWTAIVVAVWAVVRIALWWRGRRMMRNFSVGIAGAEVVGACLVLATAYFGGQLVYEFGVNVAHAAGN